MRGSSSRWVGAVVAIALAVPVATAQGHPADWMYGGDTTTRIGGNAGGAGIFLQREEALPGSFTVVGHEPLLNRGMNAAIAVHKNYVYVGSRTDGKDGNANNAGIMVVDVSNPAAPQIAHQIGPPFEGNARESSRELRVWRSQEILIVQHTNCGGQGAHNCLTGGGQGNSISSMRFYDIRGELARTPKLIYENTRDTHEFFIWEDPKNPERALYFAASAGNNFQVHDISPVLQCRTWTGPPNQCPTPLIQRFNGGHGFGSVPGDVGGSGIHSFSISNDGTRMYNALLSRGFGISDVSAFTDTDPATNTYRLVTPTANRVKWGAPGAHSAVKLWNQNWVYVSDEVYGEITDPGPNGVHGCPWGWTRFVDIADPTRPVVREDFRLPENQPGLCGAFDPPATSYSAHNPTLTPSIAFSTWHSGGFQAMDVTNPANVTQLAEFKPTPLPIIGAEDPRLSSDKPADWGRSDVKVVMWSYPVIQNGLIYVVDLRNGLYILKYNGPYENEVNQVGFLEGNSNQGDALCFEPVPGQVAVDCSAAVEEEQGASATVPATLALTLGGPATFGAFTPGVARDYTASTTANVISTAGDGLLSVSDPSSTATGHLVNGSFFLPQKVQAKASNAATTNTTFADVGSSAAPTSLLTWSGPVSNDAVTLDFKQSIGASDALRTGSYSKTLTFTLSTTAP
jgi:hypothetical protein